MAVLGAQGENLIPFAAFMALKYIFTLFSAYPYFSYLTGFLACRDFICYAFVTLISITGCWVLPLLLNKNYVIYLKLMRLSDKYRLTR